MVNIMIGKEVMDDGIRKNNNFIIKSFMKKTIIRFYPQHPHHSSITKTSLPSQCGYSLHFPHYS